LAVGRFSNPLQHNQIDYEDLGNEELCIVARTGHPLARHKQLQLSMLAETPWILQPLTSPARQIIEQDFGQLGMKTPPDLVECTSIFATLQLLQKSDAVAMLPESVVRDYLNAGLLVQLPLVVGKSLPGFGILTRRGETTTSNAAGFIRALRKYGALMGQEQSQRVPKRQKGRERSLMSSADY
jgi:DNA-binding transcriptional LysR family regulator